MAPNHSRLIYPHPRRTCIVWQASFSATHQGYGGNTPDASRPAYVLLQRSFDRFDQTRIVSGNIGREAADYFAVAAHQDFSKFHCTSGTALGSMP